ncbi:MAG: response regulator transcription factor [Bacteroidota bacterium]
MSILYRLLYLIGLRPAPGPRTYEINESLQVTLSTLAQQEGRPEHELLPDILAAGLNQYRANEASWPKWESLSPRERDVVALVCLGYTTRQIAARLGNAPATVKSQAESALRKFGVESRSQLRVLLRHWDFSAWEEDTNRKEHKEH